MDEDINLEELDLEKLKEINLEELGDNNILDEVNSNYIIENTEELNLGLTEENINEFYDYLKGNRERPIFAEKFFADCDSRIKESSQLVALMGLSFVPKLLGMEQSLMNSISNIENIKYLSVEDRLAYLNALNKISNDLTNNALKYNQISRDFSSVPLIYRNLLDQLLLLDEDKLVRLKVIPSLIDINEEKWQRIMEIAEL